MHYFRACQHRQAEGWPKVREELELAIRLDPSDADVLIAMYRVPDADEKFRRTTLAKIRELLRQFQDQIDDDPSDPTPYNQWAWLVSNTEGDYQQAVRYSHRSLELNSNGESAAASYLDTLGRCYYAAGDYENALKYQRQAIERVDYMQVMHRQLALFEKSLAEKQGAGSGAQEAGEGAPDSN
jgi:tetratricopeptide (TPR) repeat protein